MYFLVVTSFCERVLLTRYFAVQKRMIIFSMNVGMRYPRCIRLRSPPESEPITFTLKDAAIIVFPVLLIYPEGNHPRFCHVRGNLHRQNR
jgi:hypothetical protein